MEATAYYGPILHCTSANPLTYPQESWTSATDRPYLLHIDSPTRGYPPSEKRFSRKGLSLPTVCARTTRQPFRQASNKRRGIRGRRTNPLSPKRRCSPPGGIAQTIVCAIAPERLGIGRNSSSDSDWALSKARQSFTVGNRLKGGSEDFFIVLPVGGALGVSVFYS